MDHAAAQDNENKPTGRTSCAGAALSGGGCLSRAITASALRKRGGYGRFVDFFDHRPSHDQKDSRDVDLQDNSETVGVDVSPHLFRTAAVSTGAMLAGELPHLGNALLGQALHSCHQCSGLLL